MFERTERRKYRRVAATPSAGDDGDDDDRRMYASRRLDLLGKLTCCRASLAGCAGCLALLMWLGWVGLAGGLPTNFYDAAFRLGTLALGPCDLPMHVRTVAPPEEGRFHSPILQDECGQCAQALHIPALNGRHVLAEYAALARKRAAESFNSTAPVRKPRDCSAFQRDVVKQSAGMARARRETGRRAADNMSVWSLHARSPVVLRPLLVSYARTARPSEALPQRGACPVLKQMHAYHCRLEERAEVLIDGVRLRAVDAIASRTPTPGGATRAATVGVGESAALPTAPLPTAVMPAAPLPTALLLPKAEHDHNVFHSIRLRGGGETPWCVLQARRDLERIGAGAGLRLIVDGSYWASLSEWEQSILEAGARSERAERARGASARRALIHPDGHVGMWACVRACTCVSIWACVCGRACVRGRRVRVRVWARVRSRETRTPVHARPHMDSGRMRRGLQCMHVRLSIPHTAVRHQQPPPNQ